MPQALYEITVEYSPAASRRDGVHGATWQLPRTQAAQLITRMLDTDPDWNDLPETIAVSRVRASTDGLTRRTPCNRSRADSGTSIHISPAALLLHYALEVISQLLLTTELNMDELEGQTCTTLHQAAEFQRLAELSGFVSNGARSQGEKRADVVLRFANRIVISTDSEGGGLIASGLEILSPDQECLERHAKTLAYQIQAVVE
jgi:hypothetical protein